MFLGEIIYIDVKIEKQMYRIFYDGIFRFAGDNQT
jgi:hypothetical protein